MPEPLLNAAMVRWLNELAMVGIFTTDADLVVRSWNQWLERVTGRSEASVVGKRLFDLYPELSKRNFDRHYTSALRGEVSVLAHRFHGYLLHITTPAGDMPQSVRVAPLVHDEAIIGTITVIEDVSERVNSEAELRRQIAAAEQARAVAEEALRLKDDFLATLSHELRTPLNAVLGWTRILLGHPVEQEVLERALTVIDRNAAAQARLIDDMLDMARIVSGKLRLEMGPVDLVAATLAAIDVVAPAANAKNLTINRHLGRRKQIITADADRIQQIAWNVLANSVKFTPSGGTINVRIEADREMVRLIVSDTGKGISPLARLPAPRLRALPSGKLRCQPYRRRSRAGSRAGATTRGNAWRADWRREPWNRSRYHLHHHVSACHPRGCRRARCNGRRRKRGDWRLSRAGRR
jgi:PAS domain S-box-containing protein